MDARIEPENASPSDRITFAEFALETMVVTSATVTIAPNTLMMVLVCTVLCAPVLGVVEMFGTGETGSVGSDCR